MKTLRARRVSLSGVALAVVLFPSAEVAAFTVTSSPRQFEISRTTDTTIVITWNAQCGRPGPSIGSAGFGFWSQEGNWVDYGGGGSKDLIVGNCPSAGFPLTKTESVTVPASIVAQAERVDGKPQEEIHFRRSFQESPYYEAATVTVDITLRLAAARAVIRARPSRATVTPGRDNRVRVGWEASISPADVEVRVMSSDWEFRLTNGRVLRSGRDAVPRWSDMVGRGTFTLPDVVEVPAQVLREVASAGQRRVDYRRKFEVSQSGNYEAPFVPDVWAGLALYLPGTPPQPDDEPPAAPSGSIGSVLKVARLALRYEDGSRLKIVPVGSRLRAVAEVSFEGSGPFMGAWEAAGPVAGGGAPIFRRLEMVNRQFAAQRQVVLAGPFLPTDATGVHLVRFVIERPAVSGSEAAALQYFVGESAPGLPPLGAMVKPQAIVAEAPGPAALLGGDATFRWQGLPGSLAYQVEIYRADAPPEEAGKSRWYSLFKTASDRGVPVAGIVVAGTQVEVALSQLAGSHLEPGVSYLWRVVAIDREGRVIGESPLRGIKGR